MILNQKCIFNILILCALSTFGLCTSAYAQCSSPAGPAGRIDYTSGAGENVFKYCNGTDWVPWAGEPLSGIPAPQYSSAGGGTPGGANSQIQYNSNGSFAGTGNFFWDNTNARLTVGSTASDPDSSPELVITDDGAGQPAMIFLNAGEDITALGMTTDDFFSISAEESQAGIQLRVGGTYGSNDILNNATPAMTVLTSGLVGIGAASAATRLDVNGTLKVAYGGESCDASREGAIYYDSAADKFYGCQTAGSWTELGSGGSSLVGKLRMEYAANCYWSTTSASYASLTTSYNDCNAATVTGSASAPSEGKIPAVKFASLPAGDYEVIVNANMEATYGSGNIGCYFRIYDGTNDSGAVDVWDDNSSSYDTSDRMVGTFSYATDQTDITFYVQATRHTGSTGSCRLYTGSPGSDLPLEISVIALSGGSSGGGGGGSSDGAAGFIQFSDGAGAFLSDSTTDAGLFWDSTNHRLGIGDDTPEYRFDQYQYRTDTASGYFQSMENWLEADPGSASAMNFRAAHNVAEKSGTQDVTGAIVALQNEARINGTGTINLARGVYASTENASTATITSGRGGDFEVNNYSTGTITMAMGVQGWLNNTGGGTITDGYGFFSGADNTGGSITNWYGLFVDTIFGTDPSGDYYGIYVEDPDAGNYFAGSVAVGTASPDSYIKMHVSEAAATTSPWKGGAKFVGYSAGSDASYNGVFGIETYGISAATGAGFSEAYGIASYAQATNDAKSQAVAAVLGNSRTFASDVGYSFRASDDNTGTGGTAYGLYIDLDNTNVTRYGIWQNSANNNYLAGNLGIGTVPSVALDVVGDIHYTGVLVDVSDIRLKDNIMPLESPLKKLTSLNGFSFEMKNDPDHNVEYGVSAQDVQKVFPELVRHVDDNGTLGVSYNGLIAPMIEAMKEQQTEIEALRAQNEMLMERLEKLEQSQIGAQ